MNVVDRAAGEITQCWQQIRDQDNRLQGECWRLPQKQQKHLLHANEVAFQRGGSYARIFTLLRGINVVGIQLFNLSNN